jgi:hypothetical protein
VLQKAIWQRIKAEGWMHSALVNMEDRVSLLPRVTSV